MATGARGEGLLTVDGETYAVLFTLRALADAERATGKTVMQLMTMAQAGAFGVGDLAQLLTIGLEYARREGRTRAAGFNLNDAWRLLDQLGFTPVATVVIEALTAVMTYAPAKEGAGPPA